MRYMKTAVILFLLWISTAFASGPDSPQAVLDSLDFYLNKAQSYDYGQRKNVLADINRLVITGINVHQLSAKIEKRLIGFLKTDATLAGKQAICRHLSVYGSAAAVPQLMKMLDSSETFAIALFALERISSPEVDGALIERLSKSKEVGVINTLGRRRSETAIPQLQMLLSDPDETIAKAATGALAEISETKALAALKASYMKSGAKQKVSLEKAILICASKLNQDSEQAQAAATYKMLLESSQQSNVKNAAFIGLINVSKSAADQLVHDAISKQDPDIVASAISLVPDFCSEAGTQAIADLLPSLPAENQVQLFASLAKAHASQSSAKILEVLDPGSESACIAGIQALAQIGDQSHVVALLQLATDHMQYQEPLVESAAVMKIDGVDQTLMAELGKADKGTQLLILKILAARRTPEIAGQLLDKLSKEEDTELRSEILRTLGVVAGPTDLSATFDFLFQTKSATEMRELEKALALIARKADGTESQIEPLLSKYQNITEPKLQAALLRSFGRMGNARALPVIQTALANPDFTIRKAAYRSLTFWPTAEPLDQLLNLADTTSSKELQAIALHGFIDMIQLAKIDDEAKLAHYTSALQRAATLNDKRMIFAGIAELRTLSALNVVEPYLSESGTKPHAEKTILAIVKNGWWSDSTRARSMMTKLKAQSQDQEVIAFAERMIVTIDTRP